MFEAELSDEQRIMVQTARQLGEDKFRPIAAKWDRDGEAPVANLDVLAENGFLGMCVPEAYGGPGASTLDLVLVLEQISRSCANTGMLMGCADGCTPRAILSLGSEDQKRRYLPGIVTGQWLPAWGMSEPNAGSDVGSITTRAVSDGETYLINGAKLWCTGALACNLFLVFARMNDAKGLGAVGAVLVERGTPGFSIGKHIECMGLRGTGMAELVFEDCRVPKTNLLLPPGEMKSLLTVFNADRIATNPPICLGAAAAAYDLAVNHLSERKQFGRRLADFQGLQWRLADMAIDIEAGRTLLWQAARRVDAGTLRAYDASITKTFINEMSVRVTNGAIQMLGASGYSKEFAAERHFRDVRGLSIGYGTTEIQRNMIAQDVLAGVR
jgi:alkylation response protein AidB-like acyl-CoA dehydrogenase